MTSRAETEGIRGTQAFLVPNTDRELFDILERGGPVAAVKLGKEGWHFYDGDAAQAFSPAVAKYTRQEIAEGTFRRDVFVRHNVIFISPSRDWLGLLQFAFASCPTERRLYGVKRHPSAMAALTELGLTEDATGVIVPIGPV